MLKKLLSLSLAVAMILSLGIVSAYSYETNAVFSETFSESGTLSGLGGKSSEDLSYSHTTSDTAYTLPYGSFRVNLVASDKATEPFVGVATVEASVLFNDVSELKIKAHTKGANSTNVLADAVLYTYTPADENRWHRVAWQLEGTETSSTMTVFVDGTEVASKAYDSAPTYFINTLKFVPTLSSETGYLAIDDIVSYKEAYTPAEISVAHTATKKVSYDADSAYFSVANGAVASDITSNLTLADGVTATVYADDTYTALSDDAVLNPGNFVVITDGVNFKYCEIGSKKALLTTDYNTDGTLAGLGGKAEDDLSYQATDKFVPNNQHYQKSVGHGSNSTDVLIGYVTVEASVLFNDVSNLAINAHLKNSGNVSYGKIIDYVPSDENRWHRIAWEYYGTDASTTMTVYIDGAEAGKISKPTSATWFINQLWLVPTLSSETGYLAIDDIITYRSAYEKADLSFTLNENDKTRYNAETGVIEYLEGASASDVISNITAEENVTVKVYTDSTLKTEAETITADSVVLLTDGVAYKYISVLQLDTFEEEQPEPVVTVKTQDYTMDGTLFGIGGKDSTDASFEVAAGTSYDAHMMYRFDDHAENSTEAISGYVTTEYSMLVKDAETVQFISRVRKSYMNGETKEKIDAIGYKEKTYTPADTNKWHRVAWELYVDEKAGTPSTLNVYIDGELFWERTGTEVATWIEYLRLKAVNGSIAIDDVKVYQGAYTPSTFEITYTDNSKVSYNAETATFKVNGATASDITSAFTDGVAAKVYADATLKTALSDTETVKAGNTVVVTDGTIFKYAKVTDKDIVNSYDYNINGTLEGIGGKNSSDKSKQITSGSWDAEYAYRIANHGQYSTTAISGYITTEYSMLIENAETVNFIRRTRNTTETDGTKTTVDAIGYKEKIYIPDDTNKWHRVAWELYVDETAETASVLKVYIDGEVFWEATSKTATTWIEYFRIAPKGGSVAVDDIITYREAYKYEDTIFNFADSENVAYKDGMFLFKDGAKASDITENISGLNGNVTLYTDNTFETQLTASDALVNKAVAVVTSSDGLNFKYVDIRIDDFVKYTYEDTKTVRLVEKEDTFVYAYGAKVSDLTANYASENGTTIAVYENADSDVALDSTALLADGNIVVLKSPLSYETKSLSVKNKLYIGNFLINFEEDEPTALKVQNGKEQYITKTEFKAGTYGKTSASKAEVITVMGGPVELSLFEDTKLIGLNTELTETFTIDFSVAMEGEFDDFEVLARTRFNDSDNTRGIVSVFSTVDSYADIDNAWFKENLKRWVKFSMTVRPSDDTYDIYVNDEKIVENEPIEAGETDVFTGFQYLRIFVKATEASSYTLAVDDISVYYGEYDNNPDSQAVIKVADGSDAVLRNDKIYVDKFMDGGEEYGYDPDADNYPITVLNGAKLTNYLDSSYDNGDEGDLGGWLMTGDIVVIESKDGTMLKYYTVAEPALDSDNISLYIDGKRTNNIKAGQITASVAAYAPEVLSKNATLYLAFYKDNKLLELVSSETKAISGETSFETSSYTLTDVEGVTVKAMFIDTNLKPVSDYKTFID